MTLPRFIRFSALVALTVALTACDGRRAGAGDSTPADSPESNTGRTARTLPIPEQAGAGLPPDHPPVGDTEAQSNPAPLNLPPPADVNGAKALVWSPPAGWIAEPPPSPMRRAQYRVPGPGGDAECAVFYFGPGQGGDPMANAERWAGQFKRPDGGPSRDTMQTRNYTVGDISVLEVEVTGTYDGGQTMTAAPPSPQPGAMLLGAVATGPDANWFFKLTGPESTVRAQRGAFEKMIRSLKSGARN